MTDREELAPVMREAARHREFERLLAFSVPRDGAPLAWRRALHLMFWVVIIDRCHDAEPGAYLLLLAAMKLRRGNLHPKVSGGVK